MMAEMAKIDYNIYLGNNMLCLNDDCLLEICKHLGLRDKMSFALTHSRCAAVVKMGEKHKHIDVDLQNVNGFTSCQVEEYFRLFGATVEKISGSGFGRSGGLLSDDILHSMKNYCSNVKLLKLSDYMNLRGRLSELLLRMQQITLLDLSRCSFEDEDIPHMPNLITLNLYGNYYITGECLSRLATVQHLCLAYCSKKPLRFLMYALKSMKMLQYIYFLSTEDVTSDIFEEMIKICHNLEVLNIEIRRGVKYECLAQLPSLKALQLMCRSDGPPLPCHTLLKALVKHKAHQLEYLGLIHDFKVEPQDAVQLGALKQLKHLTCKCCTRINDHCLQEFAKLNNLQELDIVCGSVTAAGLLKLLGQCTKLIRLNIYGCHKITNAFVYEAINILSETIADRNGPLVMDVYLTRICETILKDPKYIDAASVLQLSFCAYPEFTGYGQL